MEGGVPTAFGGRACWAWTYNGVDVTFQQVVKDLSAKAAGILAVGTCASYGGIPAAGPNPTAVKSVKDVTGKTTINIAGCPPHPDWIVYVVAQLLLGKNIPVDSAGRPTALYNQTVHSQCPRNDNPESCLAPKGCRGPGTHANCPTQHVEQSHQLVRQCQRPVLRLHGADFSGHLVTLRGHVQPSRRHRPELQSVS